MPPEILVVLCLTHFRGENQLLVTVGYIRYNEEREKSMKNELAGDLTLAEGKSQYDTYCKRILANKIILAWILKYAVEEFKDMPISQIKTCIGSDIRISEVSVLPGRTNLREPEKITGESEEDSVPGEGELCYDIRFSVYYARQKERIKLIINVEAQKEFRPGYSITTRGIFYGARMLSAQKGIEFIGRDYDNIRKVYSIWICMNAPDYIGNAVSEYSICKKDRVPGIPDEKKAYDKLTVVMICLNPDSKKGNRLTKMLGVLLAPGIKAKAKIHQLENEFDIPMENDMGEELNQMCNLSDYVEEIGIKKGIEQGIERGREEGIEQGREQLLTQQVLKKLSRGKSVSEIAGELEADEDTIYRILEKIDQ